MLAFALAKVMPYGSLFARGKNTISNWRSWDSRKLKKHHLTHNLCHLVGQEKSPQARFRNDHNLVGLGVSPSVDPILFGIETTLQLAYDRRAI